MGMSLSTGTGSESRIMGRTNATALRAGPVRAALALARSA
ncbi:Uncharacterised protein [Bordetella pertussis]|nr:Uncharacterised protein [Bordetella pertussis]